VKQVWTSKRQLSQSAPELFIALHDLLTACRIADAEDELSSHVDGVYLDAAQAALDEACKGPTQ
jgi:hypothetical protein